MAFVFVLADILAVAKDLAVEINTRLEASKNLSVYCRDLRALVMQVVDLMATLPENTSVETGVKATNDLLREILDFIKKDEDYAETEEAALRVVRPASGCGAGCTPGCAAR